MTLSRRPRFFPSIHALLVAIVSSTAFSEISHAQDDQVALRPASLKPYAEIGFPEPKLSDHKKQAKLGPNLIPVPAKKPTRLQAERNRTQLEETYSKLPLSFEANAGQTAEEVKFLSRGPGYILFLTATETVMVLREPQQNPAAEFLERKLPLNQAPTDAIAELRQRQRRPVSESRSVLRMKLAGGSSEASVAGLNELPGTTNYFIGNDPGKWRTGIRRYAGVKYSNVYPGVDLVYYGNGKQLEFDFVVAPGADAHAIQMVFEGADDIEIDSTGNLLMKVSGQPLKLRKPTVYQDIDGLRKEVAGTYIFDGQSRLVGFDLAKFDASRPVIIDPVLEYSTHLGGTDADVGVGIAVDAQGSAYITGETVSIDFPTTPGAFESGPRYDDAFVLKLSPDGSALEYATYLGGSALDWAVGIALDPYGNA
jgi:Beta-propeller repeat